jgi:hypothetical protein
MDLPVCETEFRETDSVWLLFHQAAATPKFSCTSPNCKVAASYTGTVTDLFFLAYFPYFEKLLVNGGLWDRHAVCVFVFPLWNWISYQGIWTRLYKSHPSASLSVFSPVVARQRLGKNVTAATNTHTTTEESLGASFTMLSVSYRRKVGN